MPGGAVEETWMDVERVYDAAAAAGEMPIRWEVRASIWFHVVRWQGVTWQFMCMSFRSAACYAIHVWRC